jgi:hypothetical protein
LPELEARDDLDVELGRVVRGEVPEDDLVEGDRRLIQSWIARPC